MSGSNSSARASGPAVPEPLQPLSFTVHSLPSPDVPEQRRTRQGRLKMLLVLLICASPVIASYFTYFVIRPEGRTNYSTLIDPQRPLPDALPLTDLTGQPVAAHGLHGQWLMVVVAHAACDASCEKLLYLQRQMREALGREKDRVDKVWLIDDAGTPRPEVLAAIRPGPGAEATVLRAPRNALAAWLQPEAGQPLEAHIYLVDPMGNWMMRSPADPEPAKLKRDLEKLLRASSSWDNAGR
jgi:hypothetical protein